MHAKLRPSEHWKTKQNTYNCTEHRGWCLGHGCGCWTRCGTPWVKSVVINRTRKRVLVDEATREPVRSGTNVSLGGSRGVEHDEGGGAGLVHVLRGARTD